MNAASWYVTNNPSTQNMTKQTLGNRSFINQVKYSPKYQSVAIVGTNDGNVRIGFNLGTGVAGQANWVNVTGGNAVLPNRPVLGIALDPSSPTPRAESATRRSAASTPTRRPRRATSSRSPAPRAARRSPGRTRSGNLPDIPVDSVIVNPNFPQQVFAGTDFGLYFTNDITAALADLAALHDRPAARDDLGHADRPRRDDAVALDARPRRLRLGRCRARRSTGSTRRSRSARSPTGRTRRLTSTSPRRPPRACRSRSPPA